jgi:hypothetical protein
MEKAANAISIPTELYKRIEEKLTDSDASSVEEYIVQLLEEKFPKPEGDLSQDEEDKVKERLKALGYMD